MRGAFLTVSLGAWLAATAALAQASCDNDRAALTSDFPGARLSTCEAKRGKFLVTIEPEDRPINPSPWYAFRIEPKQPGKLRIVMRYGESKHRYRPKVSRDGTNWTLLEPDRLRKSPSGKTVTLRLRLDAEPVFIAGQELLLNTAYEHWIARLAAKTPVATQKIGDSVEGRPLTAVISTPPVETGEKEFVIFVSRQHPPEVTGSLANLAFLETVFGGSPLAERFRRRFHIVAVPNLNPDGVTRGHWRHNVNGVDLNRDWGPFTQPETQAMLGILDDIAADPNSVLRLLLDFHSTRRNVFYTQTREDKTVPPGFTERWLNGARERLKGYEFEHAERPLTDRATSKNYTYRRFGAPAITYEVGDRTDRRAIRASAVIFAEEMMETLLGYSP